MSLINMNMAGSETRTVLSAFMFVSSFAGMRISNVAAPALFFMLIRPILRTLPLGIALAANIGGQSSVSPRNLIAIGFMDPQLDWMSWFLALPVLIISIVLVWLLLLANHPARALDGDGEIEIPTIRPTREDFTLKQVVGEHGVSDHDRVVVR